MPNTRMSKPFFNQHTHHCPDCHQTFPPLQTRLVYLDGKALHHACANARLGHTPPPDHYDIDKCANCHLTILGERRISKAGYPIHKVCPPRPKRPR